jgi:hypothetical protein
MGPSIELLMHLAGREAIESDFPEIQPEHLLEGLLKLSEFPVEHLGKMVVDPSAVAQIETELEELRRTLSGREVDSAVLRRALRSRLGNGGKKFGGEPLHRSAASRKVFERSAALAKQGGARGTAPVHVLRALLAEPTPIVEELVGKRRPSPGGPPAADDGRREDGRASAECEAAMHVLAEARQPSLVLVTDDRARADQVLSELAGRVGRRACPEGLAARRLVDLRSARGPSELVSRLNEAGSPRESVLLLPPLDGTDGDPALAALCSEPPDARQCVCVASAAVHERCTQRDPRFSRRFHVMWLHPRRSREIPDEI